MLKNSEKAARQAPKPRLFDVVLAGFPARNDQETWDAILAWYQNHHFPLASSYMKEIISDWHGRDPRLLLCHLVSGLAIPYPLLAQPYRPSHRPHWPDSSHPARRSFVPFLHAQGNPRSLGNVEL